MATSLAALAAIGLPIEGDVTQRTKRKVEDRVLEVLAEAPDIADADLERAANLLGDLPRAASFDPVRLAQRADGVALRDAVRQECRAALNIAPDDRKLAMIMDHVISAGIEVVLGDATFSAAITRETVLQMARDQAAHIGLSQETNATVRELAMGQDRLEAMMQALLDKQQSGSDQAMQGFSDAELVSLAKAFGGTDRADRAGILEFLGQKAVEYRALVAEVESLKGLTGRIDNIHAAALEAVRRLDLDEAKALVDSAREIQEQEVLRPALEANAKLLETSAEIELLRGDAEAAYGLFCTAADGFRSLDVREYARRRDVYREQLYEHGLRYGGTGLARAIDIARPGIAALEKTERGVDWAGYTQNLAIALQTQGSRTEGAAGTELLGEAVAAYRAALEVYTRDAHPVAWAMTTQNLAGALQTQGTRTEGAAGTELLGEAVAAYRAALEVRTRDAHPVAWAKTTQNLAVALQTQGSRTEGAAGTELLGEAVAAYRAALEVRTRDVHPVHWAGTTQNLAAALQIQGSRTDGAAGTELLGEAVAAYRAALEVRTRDAHPVAWAMTKENMARAEQALAEHQATGDPAPHLRAALGYVEEVLEVFDPEHMAFNYQKAAKLRDALRAALEALEALD